MDPLGPEFGEEPIVNGVEPDTESFTELTADMAREETARNPDASPKPIKSINHYKSDYMNTFLKNETCSFRQLKTEALRGSLRSCRFRSICWRIFLDCLPESRDQWLDRCREQRSKYDELREKYSSNPRGQKSTELTVNNPLSQESSSSWNQYFQDNDLRIIIKQDVVRTFPEISFFSEEPIQKCLCDILFYYAKEHPNISYKQGMHEILAPLFFVVYSDQQTCQHATELNLLSSNDQLDIEIKTLLDSDYHEHDTYFLFQQVMETIEPWYSQDSPTFRADRSFEPFTKGSETTVCSVLGVKLKMIYEQILRKQDSELYDYMEQLQITPQIFGIRWMRLLFGREFAMQDLLVVWDAIFSDGISFSLCDYIFVAMLVLVRKYLLHGDYSQAMGYLMRYPSVSDVHYIIELALHFKDPLNHMRPSCHSSQVLPTPMSAGQNPRLRRDHLMLTTGAAPPQKSPTSNQNIAASVSSQNLRVLGNSSNRTRNRSGSDSNSRPKSLALATPVEIATEMTDRTLPAKSFRTPPMTSAPSSVPVTPAMAGNIAPGTVPGRPQQIVEREMRTFTLGENQGQSELKLEYCWTHMSSQIEILQKCLSCEKGLQYEDQIFVALAELKKVRDILKGSLPLKTVDDVP